MLDSNLMVYDEISIHHDAVNQQHEVSYFCGLPCLSVPNALAASRQSRQVATYTWPAVNVILQFRGKREHCVIVVTRMKYLAQKISDDYLRADGSVKLSRASKNFSQRRKTGLFFRFV